MFNLLGRRFKQLAVLVYLIMINNIKYEVKLKSLSSTPQRKYYLVKITTLIKEAF